MNFEWMNEKAVFFFFRCGKKKTAVKSNEWMAYELFRGKKKHTKKTHTHRFAPILGRKKNSNAPKNRSPISVFGFFWVWFRINPIFGVYAVLVTVFVWIYFYFIVYLEFLNFWKSSPSPDLEWMDNELFRGKKKNTCVFFFPAIFLTWEKKNTIFGFEWMNDQRTCPRKKKNTIPLARSHLCYTQCFKLIAKVTTNKSKIFQT